MHHVVCLIGVVMVTLTNSWTALSNVCVSRWSFLQRHIAELQMDQSVVFIIDRWSFCTGGPSIQVVLLYRWSFCTGGPSVQVVHLYRWYTCGPSVQVILLCR